MLSKYYTRKVECWLDNSCLVSINDGWSWILIGLQSKNYVMFRYSRPFVSILIMITCLNKKADKFYIYQLLQQTFTQNQNRWKACSVFHSTMQIHGWHVVAKGFSLNDSRSWILEIQKNIIIAIQDIRGVTINSKTLKNRQYNGQQKKDKRTNNDLQNTIQKTNDWVTRTLQQTGMNQVLRAAHPSVQTRQKWWFHLQYLFFFNRASLYTSMSVSMTTWCLLQRIWTSIIVSRCHS